ncbi:gamma carbonic anhydrase family protein [Novosphingobium album (ex Liu et al. 2023)]|uniref:Gamma carbonic anhydrase family protein n=1 Tax=Novosphingobium album (ex Liu et al. 2023) TaxID=3031130 RepID=A0ABT5WP39_9SPHN|nr:gamma carbonic anhydrase family protein [Novosphingobium album (ex Liu et al. 2023)]MDE8651798.1 gamma carbonic anhydrase family protein [Novosphingobium album (ex Liu et al. 2023)]
MTANRTDITLAAINGKAPRIHSSAFIAPGCRIIGNVEIGPDASIWYNCVIRADAHRVVIGARSNIQDGTVVHCDSPKPGNPDGFPTIIGDDVLIGHMAMVHGCVLEDRAFVGLGAIVMDGCRIASDGMLGAGAMLTPGKAIGPRELWIGRPAKHARDLDDAAIAANQAGVKGYVINAGIHAGALGLDR